MALHNQKAVLHEVPKAKGKQRTISRFVYSYDQMTDQLHRTNLVTGGQSSYRVPEFRFKMGCRWCELPGGSLLITGRSEREAVKIETRREFTVLAQPPMHTARSDHAAVYHSQYVYVLGGCWELIELRECERFVLAESRWEALPGLPVACYWMSAVVVKNSLFGLGGNDGGKSLDTVQKLSLDTLTWKLLELRLPRPSCATPCFKVRDTQVYFVIHKTLYSFTPLEVTELKTLPESIKNFAGRSCYCRGTLYYSTRTGAARRTEIGQLS
jgi:hypothetical protein